MLRPSVLAAALIIAPPCAAQSAGLERITWRLMDFAVLGDSINGTQIVASPTYRSKQGREHAPFMTFTLEPVATRRWVAGATAVVDSVSAVPRKDVKPFQSVPLIANRGRAMVALRMDSNPPRATPFVVLMWDSVAAKGWTVQASRNDLRALLTALDKIASGSVLDSTAREVNGTPYLECELDAPPHPERFRVTYPTSALRDRKEGRVLANFVIDSSGAVVVDSMRILLSDARSFAEAVRHALPRAVFAPGRRQGRAVRTVVWQWVEFRIRR